MVGMLVPLKGGIGSIWGPPEGKDYKWYISGIFPANWGIICYRSHLLWEPKTTIEQKNRMPMRHDNKLISPDAYK